MLEQFFGGKKWFKSLTAWGLIVFMTAGTLIAQLCQPGVDILSPEMCEKLAGYVTSVGGIMVVLGLRKAATSTNVG